eukprot:14886689-Heterocapsa_arctica.AAC.1
MGEQGYPAEARSKGHGSRNEYRKCRKPQMCTAQHWTMADSCLPARDKGRPAKDPTRRGKLPRTVIKGQITAIQQR